MRAAAARRAMIDAAEELVAERGLSGLTLKAVQEAAGQANKSAATYHFGSRDGLLDALLAARMAAVDERRDEMLQAVVAAGATTVRGAVEALVRPLAAETLERTGSHYARFLVQAWADPTLGELVFRRMLGGSFRPVREWLVELCPLPSERARDRVAQVTSLVVSSIALREASPRTSQETDSWVEDLIEVCVAAMTAPEGQRHTMEVTP